MYETRFGETANKIGIVQGDIPARYVAALPANVKPRNNPIVALGEVTGHHHVVEIVEGNAELFDDALGNLFMLVKSPVRIMHHEHGFAQFTEPGIVQFGQAGVFQVEYAGEEERRALD
jgi:hypothetical protein